MTVIAEMALCVCAQIVTSVAFYSCVNYARVCTATLIASHNGKQGMFVFGSLVQLGAILGSTAIFICTSLGAFKAAPRCGLLSADM